MELLFAMIMLTCIYVFKKGHRTIGQDTYKIDQQANEIYYELSNEDMMRGTVNIKKKTRHYGDENNKN